MREAVLLGICAAAVVLIGVLWYTRKKGLQKVRSYRGIFDRWRR